MKYRKPVCYLVLFSLFFAACNKDKLDVSPQTFIDESIAFSSPEKTLAAINGIYAGIKGPFYNGSSNQFLAGRYNVFQEVRGEDFINETANGVTGLQTWNFTVQSATNEVEYIWGSGYQAINRINVVLAGLDGAAVTDELKNQYKGEARFLRALVYHSLVTLYARPYWDNNGGKPGLVIYTEPQATASGVNQRPRSTVAEVYELILEDLNFAEANLPETQESNQLNVTRAHKNTAIALKTRVYLHMQRYADLITEAAKIVSTTAPFKANTGVPHTLETDITNVFRSGGQTLENILSLSFTAQSLPGTQNSMNQYYSPGSVGGNGDYSLNTAAGGILSNPQWKADDKRRTELVGIINNKTWLRKWTANTDYIPMIRYSEVLLNLAEARARMNGMDAMAIALLNAVHQRSDPGDQLTPANATDLVNMILTERRMELLGEGFRSRDLLRLGLTIPAKGTAQEVGPDDSQYIWPIPVSERLANPMAEQNPGY